jgi:hypothetical protein
MGGRLASQRTNRPMVPGRFDIKKRPADTPHQCCDGAWSLIDFGAPPLCQILFFIQGLTSGEASQPGSAQIPAQRMNLSAG